MEIKDRIIQVMEHEGQSPSKFAETIGIQRASMSHIISGRNNPSLDVLMKIMEQFTYIDPDWLLFGRGDMTRGNKPIQQPDLFTNMAINQPEGPARSEYRKEIGVNSAKNTIKDTVNEKVITIEKPSRNVSKIMVFYTDNTFDTFIPEKNK